jgi:CBS domain-containing protein
VTKVGSTSEKELPMKVEQVMSRNPVSCRADDSLQRAAQLMWEHDVGAVPVVDAAQRVIGMITDRDVCMSAYTQGRALGSVRVSTGMAHQVECCHPDDSLMAAQEAMRARQVRRLPVVDHQGKLVGMLSLNDLARATIERPLGGSRIAPEQVATTLAAVCSPRIRAAEDRAQAAE